MSVEKNQELQLLNRDEYGEPDAPILLIVHGLFGSARNWRAIAKRMSAEYRVIVVDNRNHGHSFHDPVMNYPVMADDLARVITAAGRPAMVLGHSMGGKASMYLALRYPELVTGLMVGDIAPIKYVHGMGNVAHANAMLSIDLATCKTRAEVAALLAQSVTDPSLQAFFLQSLKIDDDGAHWLPNLAVLKSEMATIVDFPETDRTYDGPTLFLAGEESDFITDDGRDRAVELFPNARFAKLKAAGHWLHADQPRAFMELLQVFTTRVAGRSE